MELEEELHCDTCNRPLPHNQVEQNICNLLKMTPIPESERSEHLYGCQYMQGIGLPCNCKEGVVDGVVGDAPCRTCGLDNRHGSHSALEMCGHLSHSYDPEVSSGSVTT